MPRPLLTWFFSATASASCVFASQGKTVLDILTSFYQQHKEDMDEEDRLMYKKLYAELKNMGTCPRPAPTTTNISPACTVTSGAVLLPEDLSDEDSPLRNERAVSPILCDPLPLLKRSGKRTTGSSGASLYRSSIAALGSSSSLSAFASTQKSGPKKPTRIPSLLADEDLCGDDNDWLVDDDDDLLPQAARKAKRPHAPKFAEPTRAAKSGGWRRQKTRVSESPPEAAAEIDVAFASSDYTEDIPALATPANPPLRPAPMNNPVLHQERSAFRLKVKVEDDVFNIAVPDKCVFLFFYYAFDFYVLDNCCKWSSCRNRHHLFCPIWSERSRRHASCFTALPNFAAANRVRFSALSVNVLLVLCPEPSRFLG